MSNTPTITASPSYEAGVYKWYDSVSGTYTRSDSTVGTNASDSMDDTTILFEVPADYEASVNLSLTVDDWGTLTVTDEAGNEKLKLSLTSAEDAPGVRGWHAEWSDSGSVNLPAGKYQIKIHHENVTYTGEYADKSVFNVSKCNFSLNGTKQLVSENLMTQADAHRLMSCYNTYNYPNKPKHSDVWSVVGGTAAETCGPDSYSCAVRVSMGLCDYGATLPAEMEDDGKKVLGLKNSKEQYVFVRARNVHSYLKEVLGEPTFSSKNDFDTMLTEISAKGISITDANKPVIVWSKMTKSPDHVGMGYNNEGCAAQGTFAEAGSIWVLYRPDYRDPETSIL